MAKITSPLLSLGASGTIGDTITFGKWKGINTARQRVVPSNPKSAGQVAQRLIMSSIVSFWRGFLTGPQGKIAWNRDASQSGKAQSGFNAFTSAATRIAAQDVDASMVIGCDDPAPTACLFQAKNLDDGANGDEAGNFTLNYGSSITQMLGTKTATISAGALEVSFSGEYDNGDVVFCQWTKTAGDIVAAKRSGIFQLTLQS